MSVKDLFVPLDKAIVETIWEIEILKSGSKWGLGKGDKISVEAIESEGGRWRYVQQGQGVQQSRFLRLCQADPEERGQIKIRS